VVLINAISMVLFNNRQEINGYTTFTFGNGSIYSVLMVLLFAKIID
jgi:hypothetical protein